MRAGTVRAQLQSRHVRIWEQRRRQVLLDRGGQWSEVDQTTKVEKEGKQVRSGFVSPGETEFGSMVTKEDPGFGKKRSGSENRDTC